MSGLPGGAGREGPATWLGLAFVTFITILVVAGVVAALFYAAELITLPPAKS